MYGFGSVSNENEIWTGVGHPIGDLIIELASELNEHNTIHQELMKKANALLESVDWDTLPKS